MSVPFSAKSDQPQNESKPGEILRLANGVVLELVHEKGSFYGVGRVEWGEILLRSSQECLVPQMASPEGLEVVSYRLLHLEATPDDRIPEDMGFFGMGVTTGWSVVADKPGRLHLSAYGQELFLDAFAVEGGCCVPAPLRKIRRPAGEETRLASSFECDIDEYLFPDKTTWFGVVLELRKITANVPAMARVELEMKGRSRHFKCGDLGVSLFESPTGEQVQLYPEDWRTLPLFRSPDHLLWPGQWLQQSINA